MAALSSVTGKVTGESSLLEGEGSALERMKRYLSVPRPDIRGCRVGRMTQDPQVVEDAELLGLIAEAFDTSPRTWHVSHEC